MSKPPKRIGAFTLVELIMCTALAALLMTAVATALASVTSGVRGNDSYSRARNGAQRAIELMVAKLRVAKEFEVDTAGTGNRLRVMEDGAWDAAGKCWRTSNARWSLFEVNSAGELVMSLESSDANGSISALGSFVLARHVRHADFRTALDSGMNRSVTIDLTVDGADAFSTGKSNSFSISGTAMVRSMRKEQTGS